MSKKLKDFRKKVRVVFEEFERILYRVLLVVYLLTSGSTGHSSDIHNQDIQEKVVAQATNS